MFRIRIERRPEAESKFTWGDVKDTILEGFLVASALCFPAVSILLGTSDRILIRSASLAVEVVTGVAAVGIIALAVSG